MAQIPGVEPVLATLRWQLADGTPYNKRIRSIPRIMVCQMGKRSLWWKTAQIPATTLFLLEARSGRVRPFLNSQFNETYPEFSPDGRWIAYTSNESKRSEVYVGPFPVQG